jgi:hypothetical protein
VKIDDALYRELLPDMDALTIPVFEFSELCIRKRGGFLPHGAVLTGDGQIVLVGASVEGATADTLASPADLLPTLHEGLRETTRKRGGVATAVSEDVTITQDGERPIQAIKVLFEHQRGLTVALYTPFTKSIFRGYSFLTMISKIARPEVNAWSDA